MRRCPRCQRANPAEAVYCHNDGYPLDTVQFPPTDTFRREWRFPSGRNCRTLDELVKGCLGEWTEARNALVRRDFVKFFEESGRGDLARLVPAAEPDPEVALQAFLEQLPSSVKVAPALDVAPRRMLIPDLIRGETRIVILRILNRGSGLLHGELSLAEGSHWLRPATTRIRTRNEQPIELTIDSRGFTHPGSYFAKLGVRTNAGTLEVPIQVDVTVKGIPFHGHRIGDPQDLARLMLAKPRQAARWLEDGSLRALFQKERWSYPLEGQVLAPSLGAVQQFFEAMKLSSVPRVSLDAAGFEVTCEYPEVVTRAITLSTTSKKWVYAFVESGATWLKPREPAVAGGRQVDVLFDIDSELMEPGRTHEGVLSLTTNGGVEHTVWVRVDVRRPFEPWSRRILKPFG